MQQQIGFTAAISADNGDVLLAHVKNGGMYKHAIVGKSERNFVPWPVRCGRQIGLRRMPGERIGKQENGAFASMESCGYVDVADKPVDISNRAAQERRGALSVIAIGSARHTGRNQRRVAYTDQFVRLHLVRNP